MVCVTYTAAASVIAPAPVLSIAVTKVGENVSNDLVSVRVSYGAGSSTPNATIKVDGVLKGTEPRVPNGSSSVPITVFIPKTGVAHQICVE